VGKAGREQEHDAEAEAAFSNFLGDQSACCSAGPRPPRLVASNPRVGVAMGKAGKGTGSFGKRRNKSHTLCNRCGRRSYHIQKGRCSYCGFPSAKIRGYNMTLKSQRRKTTGTGRMRYLKTMPRRFSNGFRSGTEATKKES